MKKQIIVFLCLQIAFCSLWTVKAQTPEGRPDAYKYGTDKKDGAWWLVSESLPDVDEEWQLDPEIPANYVPVLGEDELYMVIGEDGTIEGYRRRELQEDGSWLWKDTNPDIPQNYEAVAGLENVYRVTEDGTVKYLKYIRNDDDTYCFVEVDENGNEIGATPNGMEIPSNYHRVQGNIYAVVNGEGVVTGYMERILNEDGSYSWVKSTEPKERKSTSSESQKDEKIQGGETKGNVDKGDKGQAAGDGITVINPGITQETISGGGYIETETIVDKKTSGGWVITYQTVVTRTYDANGKLLSTKKEGPFEVSKVQSITGGGAAPDTGLIESTLEAEYNRVISGLNIRSDIADSLLSLLNEERSSNGLAELQMISGSDVYRLAYIKASDMAIYNHADYDSPMYGTIDSLIQRFGVSSAGPSETLWRTTATKSSKDIHTRFQIQEYSQAARMSSLYSKIGIAVVEKNGYFYIAEIFI